MCDKDERAGIDWMKGFMALFPVLALRKPENTSLARIWQFRKYSKKYKIPPEKLNLDETDT